MAECNGENLAPGWRDGVHALMVELRGYCTCETGETIALFGHDMAEVIKLPERRPEPLRAHG